MMIRRQLMWVAAAAALVVTTPLAAAAQDFQWRGAIPQGGTIEIRGINGDIVAEPAMGNQVEVVAQKRAHRSDPASVQIQVVANGNSVTICAVYPSSNGQPNECQPGGGHMNTQNNDVTVKFTVRVPADVVLSGHTVNGEVDAERLNGQVNLSTVNGNVTFSTTASGYATTVNGSIHGEMGRADWTNQLALKTVNGSITLTLPQELNTDLKVSTVNGDISSDFSLTVQGSISRRRLQGTIGGGGRLLELSTVNGSVTLKRD